MNNNEIFEDFWANFKWPEPAPIFYRLYHDDQGQPIVYSMEDLPGKYIEVTSQQYGENNYRVLVRNGQLINKNYSQTSKLTPDTIGTTCHPADVSIIVSETDTNQRWKLQFYDNN